MKRYKLYIFLFVLTLLFWRCDKEAGLTPLTQEGQNTFSCKVNGKVWIPKEGGSIFVNIPAIEGGYAYDYTNNKNFGHIKIVAHNDGEDIELFLNTIKIGVHRLEDNTSYTAFSPSNYGFFYSSQKSTFLTSAKSTGTVNIIKSDTISGIISGTFEFDASNANGGTVKITNGRFDINSNTL